MKRCFMCLSDNGENELCISTQYESQQQKIQSMWHVLLRWFSIALVQRYAQSLVCHAFSICKNLSIVPRLPSLMILGLLRIFFISDPPNISKPRTFNQNMSMYIVSVLQDFALGHFIFSVSSVSILPPWLQRLHEADIILNAELVTVNSAWHEVKGTQAQIHMCRVQIIYFSSYSDNISYCQQKCLEFSI